jgi:HSP20 family protein
MATTMTRRSTNPITELLSWLEGDQALEARGFGLTPQMRVEDYVEDGEYVLRAEMPGIDPEKDVEVSVDGDVLTIRGERTEEERTKNRHELHYGSFSRSVTLPAGAKADEVTATYADGVLELRVPVEADQAEPRRIQVQRSEG